MCNVFSDAQTHTHNIVLLQNMNNSYLVLCCKCLFTSIFSIPLLCLPFASTNPGKRQHLCILYCVRQLPEQICPHCCCCDSSFPSFHPAPSPLPTCPGSREARSPSARQARHKGQKLEIQKNTELLIVGP